jgi:hypothetical protein
VPLSLRPSEVLSHSRGSLRLRCRFEGPAVELIHVTSLAGRTPPSVPIGDGRPLEGVSGAWIEVRDRRGVCLWRRPLHDPFNASIEVPDDEGGYTHTYRSNPSGTLVLLVPNLVEGASVVLVSSPLEFARRHEPARDVAKFELLGR